MSGSFFVTYLLSCILAATQLAVGLVVKPCVGSES